MIGTIINIVCGVLLIGGIAGYVILFTKIHNEKKKEEKK